VALLVGLLVLLLAPVAKANQVVVQVGQSGNTFTQDDVTINPGDSIQWQWGTGRHSVTAGGQPPTSNGTFDTGVEIGATYTRPFSTPGVYHYFCQVHYASGMVGVIRVSGADPAPTGAFTISTTTATAGVPVTFDASGSTTSDGDTMDSYTWEFGDGTAPQTTSLPTISHAFTASGTPNVTLTVTDAGSATSAPVSHSLTVVQPANSPPSAHFTVTPQAPATGQTVTFDGSTSSDPDGDAITSYSWRFGDGSSTTTTTPVVTHAYTHAGIVGAQLVVTDAAGNQSTPAAIGLTVHALPPPKPRLTGAHLARCAKKGSSACATLTFNLSRAVSVTVTITRSGRKQTFKRLTLHGRAGKNTVTLTLRGLKRGSYAVMLTPTGGTAARTSLTVH
jgi:plastocyanin